MPEWILFYLALLGFFASFVAGLTAIMAALLHRQKLSRRAARFSMSVSLAFAIVFMFWLGQDFGLIVYIVIALPALLGFIANVICDRQRHAEPLPVGQVSIAAILFAMTIVAMALAFGVAWLKVTR